MCKLDSKMVDQQNVLLISNDSLRSAHRTGAGRKPQMADTNPFSRATGIVPAHAWPNIYTDVLCYWHHSARCDWGFAVG